MSLALRRICRLYLVAICMAVAGGCTSLNKPLNDAATTVETRHLNHTRATLSADLAPIQSPVEPQVRPDPQKKLTATVDDGYFVGVAISGGGLRSANFSAACLFQLQKFGILQHVDYISSVSGGSITAAYYCLSTDDEWNPANLQKRLTHHFASDVMIRTFMPWNFVLLWLTDWDRSDLLADSFREHLFTRDGRELTFNDLRPARPRLLINASDLQSGKSFIFCDEMFDQLNSDLGAYPIAHAVAASSAVPVLLHQVTLRDFSTTFKQYRHLVDGGIVDNLGVKTLVDMYRAQVKSSGGKVYPKAAIFFVIDAKTNFDARISSQGDTSFFDSLRFGAGMTSTVLLNRASSATLAEIILDSSPGNVDAATLRRERDDLMKSGYVRLENVEGRPVRVVHLALSRVNDLSDLPFKSFTETVNNIETYFNIGQTEAYHLYQAAELLVEQRFRGPLGEIADDLNGSKPVGN